MTIVRVPVRGVTPKMLKPPLECVDFDGAGARKGDGCSRAFKSGKANAKFRCPNLNKGCQKGAFLYPRKKRSNGTFHYHQGIDIGAKTGTEIISVTTGEVVLAHGEDDNNGYGRVIVVKSTHRGEPLYCLYAHCDEIRFRLGDTVAEQEVIATVGHSGNAGSDAPHLHFECSRRVIPTKEGVETELGQTEPPFPRIDPLAVLESLGPWGNTRVYLPTAVQVDEVKIASLHAQVEQSSTGGRYPLGNNNTWHGGVHVAAHRGDKLVAPFDATIVALRLDPNPMTAMGAFGHTNFILLRHEIAEEVFRRMQWEGPPDPDAPPPPKGKGKSKPATPPKPSVGRGGSNEPELVVRIKHALHDATGGPFYAPTDPAMLDDGTVDDELVAAIERFQKERMPYPFKKKGKLWPDGEITQDAKTWKALFAAQPPKPEPSEPIVGPGGEEPVPAGDEPFDPKRTVYCLLMHLDAMPLDAATAKRFPWLGEVVLEPTLEEQAEVAELERRKQLGDDEERKRGITAQVGFDEAGAPSPSIPDDVEWVQRRLQRFGYFRPGQDPGVAIDGIFGPELREAIKEFQAAHVKYFDAKAKKPQPAPGFITPKGDTHKRLKEPYARIFGVTKPPVDPVFAHRAAKLVDGRAQVITLPGVKVRSGDPLWASGLAEGLDLAGNTDLFPQIHWELFSSEKLIKPWETLEDGDDDLTLDIPDKVFARIEYNELPGFVKDKLLTPLEIHEFYLNARSQFFRSTQCRFRSEWGLDVAASVARLRERGLNADSFAEDFAPYMWWDQAAKVLPGDRHVWHYNPIELMWRYEQVLAVMRPSEGPMVEPTFGSVRVRVGYTDGTGLPEALVYLAHGEDIVGQEWTDLDGCATFHGVPTGSCAVWVDGSSSEAVFELGAGETHDVELLTDAFPPADMIGTLGVTVVGPGGVPVGDVEVVVSKDGLEQARVRTDEEGSAQLELPQGYYVVSTELATSVQIVVVRGSTAEATLTIDDLGTIEVSVVDSLGNAVEGIEVVVAELGGSPVGRVLTDASGRARIEALVAGSYSASVELEPWPVEEVEVGGRASSYVVLVVQAGDVPEPGLDVGCLEVLVLGPASVPVAGAWVTLRDTADALVGDALTDGEGRASFDFVDEGAYVLDWEGPATAPTEVMVRAGVRASVIVRALAADARPAVP